MKKFILGIIVGAILFSGVSVLAYTMLAKDIKYTPKDTNWKVNNVEDAINSLKENSNHKEIYVATSLNNGGCTSVIFDIENQNKKTGDNITGTYIRGTYSSSKYSIYAVVDGVYIIYNNDGTITKNSYKSGDLILTTDGTAGRDTYTYLIIY